MKKLAYLIIAAAALTACANIAPEPELQTGDIVFVGIPAEGPASEGTMAQAIADATGSGDIDYIHAAMLEVDEEGTWIVDATAKRGVARYPLDTFILDYHRHDGSFPTFEVFRLKDNEGVELFLANAKKYLGEPYDLLFMEDNGMHYCTELVYDSFIRDGKHIFESGPMNFKNADGEFPAFWVRTFAKIGAEIPQGKVGTNPQAMHGSDAIEYVTDIEVPEKFLNIE